MDAMMVEQTAMHMDIVGTVPVVVSLLGSEHFIIVGVTEHVNLQYSQHVAQNTTPSKCQ